MPLSSVWYVNVGLCVPKTVVEVSMTGDRGEICAMKPSSVPPPNAPCRGPPAVGNDAVSPVIHTVPFGPAATPVPASP